MDPEETLSLLRARVADVFQPDVDYPGDAAVLSEVVELFDALDDWLSKGGFPPRDWLPTALRAPEPR